MTVKELINELKKHDGNLPVFYVADFEHWDDAGRYIHTVEIENVHKQRFEDNQSGMGEDYAEIIVC